MIDVIVNLRCTVDVDYTRDLFTITIVNLLDKQFYDIIYFSVRRPSLVRLS